ncbi:MULTISPECIES: hypothetical protein [unclassified Variovorax]|uniref:hypothetical protein n=1 Tax=unclassified Variovorax TaxID=663243 RepID=UPI000ADA805D|nr:MULTISPECIES: hypothetical protein [unclassified Variovorax]PNG50167.1 hypothetical protein CHC06_05790 [Variovorax sp. B2]PNG51040.1 hypothetical protein CHC07_05696 [Variovorax sp. B4]VTU42173.1 hypothetical protein SRS16P1_00207 [Variovorax sp. SRS16]VTU42205.1 hypothetical protein E5P1_00205 [Variovorax sp. PBL-E5]VTU44307.1 hypothetical protein H6P1_00726 [Variovorax sp. PBL-H6]
MQVQTNSRAQRRFLDAVAIQRQVAIARSRATAVNDARVSVQRGRFRKHHAMDCGNTNCGLCSNARRNPHSSGLARLTRQERVHLEQLSGGVRELFSGH